MESWGALANLVISCLGIIAWTYFHFDRKNMVARMDKHSHRLDDHEKRIGEHAGAIHANTEADKLRLEIITKQFEHLNKLIEDLRREMIRRDDDFKKLNETIIEYIIKRNN